MKITGSQTLSDINVQLMNATKGDPKELQDIQDRINHQVKNALTLSIVRFLEPHLPIEVEKEPGRETRSVEIYVLSRAQTQKLCALVEQIIALVPFGIDTEVAKTLKGKIACLIFSDNLKT